MSQLTGVRIAEWTCCNATRILGGESPTAIRDADVALAAPERAQPEPASTGRAWVLDEADNLILEGIACGESMSLLATRVFLSSHGVEYRIRAMLRRFGVPNRTALISKAYCAGILESGMWPPRVRR